MSRKKITIKDLRKHIVDSRKVKGGKIHTVQTPNAGTIEIAEGNSHSKGGVNYIKTSDGVTHEIENNEVVLPTEDGPYVVSDYMNVDGSKNYNKKKTSYADLVKHLAMSGASKQDLERVAMQTEVANGNDPNNPTSLIKDTNVLQQPTQEYQQTTTNRGDLEQIKTQHLNQLRKFEESGMKGNNEDMQSVFNKLHQVDKDIDLLNFRKNAENDLDVRMRNRANRGAQKVPELLPMMPMLQIPVPDATHWGGKHDAPMIRPLEETEQYQQTNDRQSKGGKDNFWGNMFGPKRTEVQVGGDDVRLEDEGSLINNQMLEYNIMDGDTTGVNQILYTNQLGNRTDTEGNEIETTDELNYNLVNGELVITDKSGKVHNNVTQVSNANSPSLFNKDLDGGSNVRTNNSVSQEWPYGNIHIDENNGVFTLGGKDGINEEESTNTFRYWMSINHPDWKSGEEGLDATGPMNGYVRKALKKYGNDFVNSFQMEPITTTTNESMSTKEINKLLKKKYQQPHKYKGGGTLVRKYQETEHKTSFEGDETTIPSDFLYDIDENLSAITEDDGSYVAQKNWTHTKDDSKNTQPTKADVWAKGFNNVQEWRDWVNTQPGFEKYDWGNLGYWGPKHDEAWKGTPDPNKEIIIEEDPDPVPCTGPNCEESSFTSNVKKEKEKITTDKDKKFNWGKWGMIGLGGLAAFGAYKAISSQMGKTDDMLEAAKNESPNLLGKQQLGKVDLQRISHRSQIVDAMMRGQSMDNSVEYMNVPEAAKYLLKERNTITTQKEVNKIKEAEDNINVGISVKEGSLNAGLAMKQADLNVKVDVANQLENRDIREQKYAAWDRQVAGRQQLISDLVKLGGHGIEAYATLKSKNRALTNGESS